MPDHLVVCWVASTPSTRVWRHPCVVLAAQLVLRHPHAPRLPAAHQAAAHGGRRARARAAPAPRARGAVRRLKRKTSGAASIGSLSRSSSWSLDAVPGPGGGGGGGAAGASTSRAARAARRLAGGARRWLGGPREAAADAGAQRSSGSRSSRAPTPPSCPSGCCRVWAPGCPPPTSCSPLLVCRGWRDCLGAQVATAHLTPALWQHGARGQLAQLRALTDAFPLLRTLDCAYQRGAPVDARTARRTMGFLARTTPSLAGLRLRGMADAQLARARRGPLPPRAPAGAPRPARRLLARRGLDGRAGGAAGRAHAAAVHSAVFSRLAAGHVAAVAALPRLRELVAGGWRGRGGVGGGGVAA